MITINSLLARALQIMTAVLRKENTALRVGSLLRDIIYFLQNIVLGIILKGEQINEASIKALPNPTRGDTWKAIDTEHFWTYDGTQWNDIGNILPSSNIPINNSMQLDTSLQVAQNDLSPFDIMPDGNLVFDKSNVGLEKSDKADTIENSTLKNNASTELERKLMAEVESLKKSIDKKLFSVYNPKSYYPNLAFSAEFQDGYDIDADWISEGFTEPSGNTQDRLRENAEIKNDALYLYNRMVDPVNLMFTSCSLRHKDQFTYGLFECNYRISAASGTNNSFWLRALNNVPNKFELDVNEGRYPNVIATNMHSWEDPHASDAKLYFDTNKIIPNNHTIMLPDVVETDRIRITIDYHRICHIAEVMCFGTMKTHPNPLLQSDVTAFASVDLARISTATESGSLDNSYPASNAINGTLFGNGNHWIAPDHGDKWMMLTWNEKVRLSSIQIAAGWVLNNVWNDAPYFLKVEYWNGLAWVECYRYDANASLLTASHNYKLLWTPDRMTWMFDDKIVRSEDNVFCHGYADLLLSNYVGALGGYVSSAVDGTAMIVENIKIYQ